MDTLLNLGTSFVLGFVAGVLSSWLVAHRFAKRRQRDQVRQVSADCLPDWVPVPGESGTRVLSGATLTIGNNSEWPVSDLVVIAPDWLHAMNWDYLGPGRHIDHRIPAAQIPEWGLGDPVILQLRDALGRQWHWTSTTGQLDPIPPPIPIHSRIVQWVDRRIPRASQAVLARLPRGVRRWLWGYDPEG